MNEIKLSDFPLKETYLYLEKEYKDSLIREASKKAGSQNKLAILLKNYIKDLKINQSMIAMWLIKPNLRLDITYWLCKYLKKEFDQSKIKAIKGAGTSKNVYLPKLPIKLSPDLANVIAKIYCDGCIELKNCYVTYYTNTCEELISEFKNYIQKSFGKIHFRIKRIGNQVYVYIPCFLGKLLYKRFKLWEHKVPTQIIKADNLIKSSYLRAVFDDEGSIHKKHGQIRLKMKHKSFLEDTKKLLEKNFGITCSNIIKEESDFGKEVYYFLISGSDNFKKFYDTIYFTHPRKKKILKTRLKTYKYDTYGKNKAGQMILSILKQGQKNLKELSKALNRDKRTVQYHLNNLKNKGLVQYHTLKKKYCYEHIWSIK